MKKIILLLALFFALPFYSQEVCDPPLNLAYSFIDISCPDGQSLIITESTLPSDSEAVFVIRNLTTSIEEAFPAIYNPFFDMYEGTFGPYEEGVILEIYMEVVAGSGFCISEFIRTGPVPGCIPGCTDSDGDTICDADDICPGFDDLANSDSDGIPDGCDNCPLLNNPLQEPDADCDGVITDLDCNDNDPLITTTPLDDADCDGVPTSLDCNDNDPNITDRLDADADGDGVADCNDQQLNSPCPDNVDQFGVSIDSDNDGTADCLDDCPNDPNKILTGSCGCGNRETDRDNDGVADCIDQELRSPCPNDVDQFGVSLDTDSDTVPDCLDKCPDFDDRIDADGDKIPDGCDDSPLCRGNKIAICHNRNGVFSTLCISPGQLERHLNHGDVVGPCNGATAASVIYETEEMIAAEQELIISPNPAKISLNFRLNFRQSKQAEYSIFNLNGVLLNSGQMNGLEGTLALDNSFRPGIYLLVVQDGNNRITQKFSVE